ncbi:sulfite oxidase-like oxidoreductase [Aquibacillus rhizosphaerae]|uniref:Sulfite oxidase-like oxidoreductase n=1 Tax=Aquibacillus rhizosphaerae TaxID=3051431 RepID=A0ABT7LB34_9BACI|nr:sulfite oxidase-like oxidoreductase [Aquibacillus sp. LR5S19]MDL4843075.1 sulfite oxidase-like oxidoreductase [Aquibacillus sp. LR5S19]
MAISKAERLKKSKTPARDARFGDRLPQGQVLTERFPILTVGDTPIYDDLSKWDLKIFGEINEEKVFTFEDILALPQKKVVCDVHCVTRWSKFDNEFEGVLFKDLLNHFEIKPEAKYVVVHGDYDYQTNLPLEDLLKDDIILAHSYNGKALTEKHGYPLRLVVPHLYFWKSAKWIRGIEFLKENRNGYWEQNGFHYYGDPYKEQRFSGEEFELKNFKDRDFDY